MHYLSVGKDRWTSKTRASEPASNAACSQGWRRQQEWLGARLTYRLRRLCYPVRQGHQSITSYLGDIYQCTSLQATGGVVSLCLASWDALVAPAAAALPWYFLSAFSLFHSSLRLSKVLLGFPYGKNVHACPVSRLKSVGYATTRRTTIRAAEE